MARIVLFLPSSKRIISLCEDSWREALAAKIHLTSSAISIYNATPALHGRKHEKRSSELTADGGCQCVIMLNPAAVCLHKELQPIGKKATATIFPSEKNLFPLPSVPEENKHLYFTQKPPSNLYYIYVELVLCVDVMFCLKTTCNRRGLWFLRAPKS